MGLRTEYVLGLGLRLANCDRSIRGSTCTLDGDFVAHGLLGSDHSWGFTMLIPWAITYRGLIILGMEEEDALWPSLVAGFVIGVSVIPIYLLVTNLRRKKT
jgi:hypothetical protein